MGKFDQIVDTAWAEAELFAESVPHVLHQDLTYLWILEKDPRQRPNHWRSRVEAWRHLITLFFSGELVPEIVGFPEQPLLQHTRPYGIENVTFLRLARTTTRMPEVVGVLSSTVLVRPLPDFRAEWLPELREAAEQKKRPEDVAHFLQLAVQQLQATEGFESAERLVKVLRQEFAPALTGHPAMGNPVTIPLLRKVEWAQRGTTPADESKKIVGSIPLLVRAQQLPRRTYIPRCKVCNAPLTRALQDAPFAVDGDHIEVPCLAVACGATNVIPIDRFLIWNRDARRALVWESEPEFVTLDMEEPPRPTIEGIEVQFTWNPAQVNGDSVRRHLRLQFAGKTISFVRPGSVFFKKLLVPGDVEAFSGYPVRPEWNDAVDVSTVTPRASTDPLQVNIDGIRLRGWPVPIALRPRVFSIVAEPSLAAGIFPSPAITGPRWKWYRTFLTSPTADVSSKYRLHVLGGKPLLEHVATSEDGVPAAITIASRTDDGLGVTYFPRHIAAAAGSQRENDIELAVDFGTTNTIVYFRGPNHTANDDPSPSANAIAPRQVAQAVHWFAKNDALETATEIAAFLPGPKYREDRSDPYIFPSTVWELSGNEGDLIIRWSSNRPTPDGKPLANFKWDPASDRSTGYAAQRQAYLTELLLFVLASITQRHGRVRSVTLGTAFPLAFNVTERERYEKTLLRVGRQITRLTGIELTQVFSISESSACVQAFGQFNAGDTFLVADMGGGTLDLALFTFGVGDRNDDMHQIGSIRYAGESFVTALAQRQPGDLSADDAAWQIRDSVLDEKSHLHYGAQQSTEDILQRFLTFAFEYLRTMIAAHRVQHSTDTAIHLVLVGNGWNLAAAFSRRRLQDGPVRVIEQTFDHLTKLIGEPNVRVYRAQMEDNGTHGSSTRFSKHLVAIGALKNTRAPQRHELTDPPAYEQLPAGRGLVVANRNLDWSDLVGAGISFEEIDPKQLRDQRIEFNLVSMAPVKNAAWRQRLLDSLDATDETHIPYPDIAKLREQTRLSIAGEPPKIERGPLQLILEQYWSKRLAVRGRK
jgi:hypothetical protein